MIFIGRSSLSDKITKTRPTRAAGLPLKILDVAGRDTQHASLGSAGRHRSDPHSEFVVKIQIGKRVVDVCLGGLMLLDPTSCKLDPHIVVIYILPVGFSVGGYDFLSAVQMGVVMFDDGTWVVRVICIHEFTVG